MGFVLKSEPDVWVRQSTEIEISAHPSEPELATNLMGSSADNFGSTDVYHDGLVSHAEFVVRCELHAWGRKHRHHQPTEIQHCNHCFR